MDDLSAIMDVVTNFGQSLLFLWLLLREMRSHAETRAQYLADLREVAGMRSARSLSMDIPAIPTAQAHDTR